jgi:hypothetical protein
MMRNFFKSLRPLTTLSNPTPTTGLPWSNRQYIRLEKEEEDNESEAGASIRQFRPQELLARIPFTQVGLMVAVFLLGATSIVLYDDFNEVGSPHIPGVPNCELDLKILM